MSRERLYRLRPWLIRALIPPAHIGSYVLYEAASQPRYIGRSDHDLQRRLLQHSAAVRGQYFSYAIHPTVDAAFHVECSLFHALDGELTNLIHPDAPDYTALRCVFCADALHDVRSNRLGTPASSATSYTSLVTAVLGTSPTVAHSPPTAELHAEVTATAAVTAANPAQVRQSRVRPAVGRPINTAETETTRLSHQ